MRTTLPNSAENVTAVVVTYNRKELLSECINALRNQTRKLDQILVINNGSTDDTESWLKQQQDLQYFSQNNSGSGGGFNTGIKMAYEQECNWIWLMDDDGFPKEDALEKLLEGNPEPLMLRNCAVINKEDKKSFVWKTKHYRTVADVDKKIIMDVSHPFNGTLLHRKIVEKVGLPKPGLFIWGDETEYRFRIINKNKIPYCTVSDSIHYHPPSKDSYRTDWDFTTNWKMYYLLRNRFAILRSRFYQSIVLSTFMYLGFIFLFAATVLVFQRTNKIKKLSFILWPLRDALNGNYKATPTIVLRQLSVTSRYNFGSYFQQQIKILKTFISQPASPTSHELKKA
jgi:rhamnopyranosyl-N-acetylglucosaminyl-diphospho-decaprenol beta-1,3/1,4-galactofuranosyltransferase